MSDHASASCTGSCYRVQVYQAIVFATPVLFASMLLLLFCLLYLKRRQGANIREPMRGQFFLGVHATPLVEHGLSKSFRQRLPTVPFDESFSCSCQDTQCAVCLGDYQSGEKLQQLPSCRHSFHVLCIDEWLAKNVTCPICRSRVLADVDGGVREAECPADGGREQPTRGHDQARAWEARVLSRAQDYNSNFIRIEALTRTTSNGDAAESASCPGPCSGEIQTTINIERS